ncbi:alpha-glucan family phosphorylase [Bacteriovorax stolpii]|uniref:Alpha-glucan phosphorylase n=2 Tax=Bacteriovorax stolpii TaxID=960 RepID=A0A2K9NPT4_BACTC|nr:alpha-glucan phosphorylase [Bacteriovorax stolpii]QDK42509.1 alpha-glucan family phosphorylase [Bacteriovorax stolpii]
MRETSMTTLSQLNDLAYNYWWSWNQDVWNLFSSINKEVWAETRNPVLVLKNTKDLEASLNNEDLKKKVGDLHSRLVTYLNRKDTWFAKNFANTKGPIAYFSAEYGIHEALPIYSGGLGVLSGDHVKSASDLGIPMVFVGLFYSNGYFTQRINEDGKQLDLYGKFQPENLSLTPVTTKNGEALVFDLELAERTIKVQAHKAMVGSSELYLLDSNHPANSEADRLLTAKLYGGDREMRISQEVILGIGGVKLLKALGIEPAAFHMNEGHSGFFQLERIKNAMKERSMTFDEAKILCASNCLFTTHTPVPAGNEAFSLPLMHKHFFKMIKGFNISWERFVELGIVPEKSDYKYFSLTVFAINVARFYNGVSELHGKIAQKMWRDQWPQVPEVENPMSHITNGVHVQTWMALDVKNLLNETVGTKWEDELANHDFWKKAGDISNSEIRETKVALKAKMISLVRAQLKKQLKENNESQKEIDAVDTYLDDKTLVIGFARRFATYKRATLIFKDLKKLEALVNNPERPVAFVFSGKAHPQDVPGQKYIEEIYKFSRMPSLKGKVIILENYDMNISRHLVSGSDVWLNNPRRPMEASGTSGQKVPINFGLNFSVLDGWWREAFDGNNGWAIGEEKDFANDEIQDYEDAMDFYKTLEQTILPLYYADKAKGENGSSAAWIEKTKISFVTNISRYSTHRMVQDYMTKFYAPAIAYGDKYKNNGDLIKTYLDNRRALKMNWKAMYFTYVHFDGNHVEVPSQFDKSWKSPLHHVEYPAEVTFPGRVFETNEAHIHVGTYLGDLKPESVVVEAVICDLKTDEVKTEKLRLKGPLEDGVGHFELKFKANDSKKIRFRIYGHDNFLVHPFEYGYMMWY